MPKILIPLPVSGVLPDDSDWSVGVETDVVACTGVDVAMVVCVDVVSAGCVGISDGVVV